jgi:hypothetical protein
MIDGPNDACSLSVEDGWVSPSYGVKEPAKVIVLKGTVAVPLDASFLFAERRLIPPERAEASEALATSTAC